MEKSLGRLIKITWIKLRAMLITQWVLSLPMRLLKGCTFRLIKGSGMKWESNSSLSCISIQRRIILVLSVLRINVWTVYTKMMQGKRYIRMKPQLFTGQRAQKAAAR